MLEVYGTYCLLYNSASLDDVKTIETKEKTSSVSIHPNHKKFVAGSDEDLWVRIYDFDSGEVSGK